MRAKKKTQSRSTTTKKKKSGAASSSKTKKKTIAKKKGPSPFEAVWMLLLRVPEGKVITYGELSRLIDGRLSPIAVGWALRAAPEGALPWHRVVGAKGAISTNAENPGLQRKLLEAEGVGFIDDRVNLDQHGCSLNRIVVAEKKKTTAKKKTKKKTRARRKTS